MLYRSLARVFDQQAPKVRTRVQPGPFSNGPSVRVQPLYDFILQPINVRLWISSVGIIKFKKICQPGELVPPERKYIVVRYSGTHPFYAEIGGIAVKRAEAIQAERRTTSRWCQVCKKRNKLRLTVILCWRLAGKSRNDI